MSEEKILQDKLRDYMYRNTIKQVDLARMLNVSTGTVSEWMSGKKYPNRSKRKIIKEKLGIDLNEPIEGAAKQKLPFDIEPVMRAADNLSGFAKEYTGNSNNSEIKMFIEPYREVIRQDMAKAVTNYILTFYGGETKKILETYKLLSAENRHKLYEHANLLLLAQERENEVIQEEDKDDSQ